MADQRDMVITAGQPVDEEFTYSLNGVGQTWTDPKGIVKTYRGGTTLVDLNPYLTIQVDTTKVKFVMTGAQTAALTFSAGEYDIWDDTRRLFYGRFKVIRGTTV